MLRSLIVFTLLLVFSAPSAAQSPDLSGRWSGYWVSDKNGHTGPLHGRFRQIDANTYRVAYHGRFWRVFPFYYRTTMQIDGAGDGMAMPSPVLSKCMVVR